MSLVMSQSQLMRVFVLTTLLLMAAIGATNATAQAFRWTTHTSTTNINQMMVLNSRIWCATSGGLSEFIPESAQFDVYTNTRGLAMNRSTVIGRDSFGWIWIGHYDARITRLNPETGQTRQITDLSGEVFELKFMLSVGEEVFIAADNGIYRFSYRDVSENFRVLESVRVIGSFPGYTPVNSLAVFEGYLFAATGHGIARIALTEQNMSAPDAWVTFTASNSQLPDNDVNALWQASDALWISTGSHVLKYATGAFTEPSDLSGVRSFNSVDGILYAVSESAVYREAGGSPVAWQQVGGAVPHATGLAGVAVDGAMRLVVSRGDGGEGPGGLVFFDGGVWSEPLAPTGIGGNQITFLGTAPSGEIWAGGLGATYGTYFFDGNRWTNMHAATGFTQRFHYNQPLEIAFDRFGGSWVGSFGGGVMWMRADGSRTYFNQDDSSGFSSQGPRLPGIIENASYEVCRTAAAGNGDIWISNRRARNFRSLVRVPSDWIARGNNPEPWSDFGTGPEINDIEIEEIVVDPFDRVWCGASQYGISTYIYDVNGTLADTTDDSVERFIPREYQDDQFTCYYDIANWVLDMEIDQQNYLWFATTNGAYYTQGGVPGSVDQLRLICADVPVGNRVNDIHVDGQDNKWFATDEGVAVLDRNFLWVHVFRTSSDADHPSDLPSNEATAITSNPANGDVWIGTADGLAKLESPYVTRDPDLDELTSYPSPFSPNGLQKLFLNHQDLGGRFDELRIYTISGLLVRKLEWSQMIDPAGGWDGRNEDGDLVSGGVYLMIASAENGGTATGKIAVLGR